jgi:DNA-binding CsgD family transcriptional regulator
VITVRKCANQQKFFYREQRDVRREVAPRQESNESHVGLDALSRDPTAEEAVALAETVEVLMGQLDERDRNIISMRLQGYSTAEISEQEGYAERTVRRVVQNVRKYLTRMSDSLSEEG